MNDSIKPAIARNIIASEDEKSYYAGFLGKDKMESFATFYKNNRLELEDITNQVLRNFLRGANRDSTTYSAAQEVAEAFLSYFVGSYGETITPESQDEKALTDE